MASSREVAFGILTDYRILTSDRNKENRTEESCAIVPVTAYLRVRVIYDVSKHYLLPGGKMYLLNCSKRA